MTAAEELGRFLRARRARVRPEDVGLAPGVGSRRTPGLRREELATLAGISIDYYTRLEQGRDIHPSTEVLDALASALLLDPDAQAHLHALATNAKGSRRKAAVSRPPGLPPGVALLLETVRPWPAYVLSPTSDILAANPETLLLFAGLSDWPQRKRNTIRYVFTHPAAPRLFGDWAHAAASAVSNLRTVLADQPESRELADLVDELTLASDEFGRLWRRYDIAPRRTARKVFRHPTVGTITLNHQVLRLDDGLRVTMYQAGPASPDHDALALLSISTSALSRPIAPDNPMSPA